MNPAQEVLIQPQLVRFDIEEGVARRQELRQPPSKPNRCPSLREVLAYALLLGSALYIFLWHASIVSKTSKCDEKEDKNRNATKKELQLEDRQFNVRLSNLLKSIDYKRKWLEAKRDDMKHRVFSANVPGQEQIMFTFGASFTRDKAVDWRNLGKVTRVKNQGSCGSCWAFGPVASIESAFAIKTGQLLSLSEQEILDCAVNYNACRGAPIVYAFNWVKRGGLVSEQIYPYTGNGWSLCRVNMTARQRAQTVYINEYVWLDNDEERLADWVAVMGPIAIAMTHTDAFRNYTSNDGIYHPSAEECEEGRTSNVSHALTIVGYDEENGKPFWWAKNSWGEKWGYQGYAKLARGHNICGLADSAYAPIIF